MTCKQINDSLDTYIDGDMSAADTESFDQHVANCNGCRQSLARARDLQLLMQDYAASSVPSPDPVFFNRALLKASRKNTKRQRNRWVMTGFSGAIAAGVAVWLIGGFVFDGSKLNIQNPIETEIPSVTMALEAPRMLNLVFSSEIAISDAMMTVTLPFGVEIKGFENQQVVTWMTSLQAGKNVLPLTLIATSPQGGELLATLQHGEDNRSFRVEVTVI